MVHPEGMPYLMGDRVVMLDRVFLAIGIFVRSSAGIDVRRIEVAIVGPKFPQIWVIVVFVVAPFDFVDIYIEHIDLPVRLRLTVNQLSYQRTGNVWPKKVSPTADVHNGEMFRGDQPKAVIPHPALFFELLRKFGPTSRRPIFDRKRTFVCIRCGRPFIYRIQVNPQKQLQYMILRRMGAFSEV